jgi:hypothetical protein
MNNTTNSPKHSFYKNLDNNLNKESNNQLYKDNKLILNIESDNRDRLNSNEISCRICLEDDEINNLISPCLCDGYMKYVHSSCLDQWIFSQMNDNFSEDSIITCEICQTRYNIEPYKIKNPFMLFYIYLNTSNRRLLFCGIINLIVLLIVIYADKNKYLFNNINKYLDSDYMIEFYILVESSLYLCLNIIISFISYLFINENLSINKNQYISYVLLIHNKLLGLYFGCILFYFINMYILLILFNFIISNIIIRELSIYIKLKMKMNIISI